MIMNGGSSFAPDQSPQCCAFKTAVDKNETSTARKMTNTVAIIFFRNNGSIGKIKIAHGSSSGRLLALAPVNNAAARIECHKSAVRRELHARAAKLIATSA